MSNANLPVVPDYLKKFMAQAPSAEADSLATASMSVPRISLRGRTFRFIEGGEERLKQNDAIHVVILGVEPEPGRFIKTYYEGVYASGDSAPPTCASSDGVKPDPWVTSVQSQFCATCSKNQFGSATSRTGKKTKACRDSKRIWVVKPDDIEGIVYGLNVPVTSLKSLAEFGTAVKSMNVPLSTILVEVGMTDAEFPLLTFKLAGFLDEQYGIKAMERNESKDWMGSRPTGPALAAPTPQVALPNNTQQQTAQPVAQPQQTVQQQKTDGDSVDDILGQW